MTRLRTCAALLAALAMAWAAPAAADVDLSRLAVTPNPRLGLAFPGSQTRYYDAISQAGIGVTRLSAAWSRTEPRPGRFDFAGLDERVKGLQDRGIHPFLTFESDADWATDPATHKVKNARPVDLGQWQQFVRRVVDRYDADGSNDMPGLRFPVHYYQAANEWISDSNRSGGWAGSTAELIAYVDATHDAVAAEDPDATFVMGGIAAFNADILLVQQARQNIHVRQSWSRSSETVMARDEMLGPEIAAIIRDRVLPVLANSRYDISSVHLYGPETRDAARLDLVRRLSGRPVLSSECGGPTRDYGGEYTPEGHFRAVIHRNLNVLAAGAPFCLWFRLGEGEGATFGNARTALYEGSGRPKPGVFAYRALSRLIDRQATVRQDGALRFEIRRGDGGRISVGWGSAAAGLRDEARAAGTELLCLADPDRGLLASDPGRCGAGAITFTGSGLNALLSP
ncbi:beta-galactosidase [Jannaschia rubra]|uniref:beta-galactosidase n=1 Tax=Jannaschia rubra TaxID=282197 RepID=UPI0024923FF0|nr:beta-galactosidase [Jannaschia rubra]